MKILGRKLLQPLRGVNPEMDRWLNNWLSEISHAKWKAPLEIVRQYPSVISKEEGIFCFRIAMQDARVEVAFCFAQGIALIKGLRND
jgi:mRNA interferase HigB